MAYNPIIHLLKGIHGRINSGILSGMQGQQSPQNVAFLRELHREIRKEQVMYEPLNKLNAVVFDIETTGFFPDKGDVILSIGAIKVDGGIIKEEDTFYSLVFHNEDLSPELTHLTGIRKEDLLNAPNLSSVLLQFFEFAKDAVLVAHHANHEKTFLQHSSWKLFRTPLKHRILDTSFLFKIADPDLQLVRLEDLCVYHDIPVVERHHALGDARLTAKLWSIYIEKIIQLGIVNMNDLYEALSKVR
ncbi:DNA polymerase-3 subunit epsilon [Bacillus mesophilus]|uniref:3'-5' exonuclease n=1 Tax=Bacillus mesophilus TaxID=1808955 RepID=A0A6M0QAD0_9BACI|nr:DNA polymerase-3 subunit epsilon [Bacillus mesophilus]NEY73255.1 3'-5' exonuclease [Bacillus mesophilus]